MEISHLNDTNETLSVTSSDLDAAVSNGETSGPSNNTTQSYRRDKCFYMDTVIFRVGGTLFKVPKSGFQVPGTIFPAMFSLPIQENEAQVEGMSDDKPIHIEQIEEDDFRSFLTILYPSKETAVTAKNYDTLLGALHLATMWEFIELRKEIIDSLTPIIVKRDNLEIISVSRRFGVEYWLREAYTNLCEQSAELPIDILRPPKSKYSLDWKTIGKIYHIRDTTGRAALDNSYCSICDRNLGSPGREVCTCRISSLINAQFEAEFRSMKEFVSDMPADAGKIPPLPTGPTEGVIEPSPATTSASHKKKKRR